MHFYKFNNFIHNTHLENKDIELNLKCTFPRNNIDVLNIFHRKFDASKDSVTTKNHLKIPNVA